MAYSGQRCPAFSKNVTSARMMSFDSIVSRHFVATLVGGAIITPDYSMMESNMKTSAERQRKFISSPKGQKYLRSKAHAESVRKYNRNVRDRIHRTETVKKVRQIKIERGCLICGFNKHHAALDFHHRNPETKKFRIGDGRNYSWKMVLEEIVKCDVLCSNCHRILEHDKRQEEKALWSGAETVAGSVC